MKRILDLYYNLFKGKNLTYKELKNLSENIGKNNYYITANYMVKNKTPKNYYKKIKQSSTDALLINNTSPVDDLLYLKLGEYNYNVYYNDTMSVIDFVNLNTMSPAFLGNRSAFDFYINIISGWFYERLVVDWFDKRGYKTKITGADSDYKVRSNSQIYSDYDFEVTNLNNNITTKIEFVNDFAGITSRYKYLPLRKSKLERNKRFNTWIVAFNHKNNSIYMFESINVKSDEVTLYGNPGSHIIYVDENTHIISDL